MHSMLGDASWEHTAATGWTADHPDAETAGSSAIDGTHGDHFGYGGPAGPDRRADSGRPAYQNSLNPH